MADTSVSTTDELKLAPDSAGDFQFAGTADEVRLHPLIPCFCRGNAQLCRVPRLEPHVENSERKIVSLKIFHLRCADLPKPN
jgi:hypothetical protein